MIDVIKWIAISVAILFILYVFSVRGRAENPDLTQLRGWSYAHRGLHNEERPENSMAAFRAALEHGYGIELDIHLMKDGNLAVIHDSSLKRTAGVDVNIEDLIVSDLANYRLEGTEEQIPLFRDVLELFDGKAPLIIELKTVGNNHAALCRTVYDLLKDYEGPYCIESFDPRCIIWLRNNQPDVIRGQLTEDFYKSSSNLPGALKFILTFQIENFLGLPDFVAYRFSDLDHFSNFLVRKLWGVQGVTWTLRSQEEYDIAVSEGWIPIFENFEP